MDPDPYKSEKLDPDSHTKYRSFRGQNGGVEDLGLSQIETWRLKMEPMEGL